MGHRVLVVDDDEHILSAFGDFLKKERCFMIAAKSAIEALHILEVQHIDLLITDIRLQGQSGIMLLMETHWKNPHLPIIVITGFPDVITESDAKSYGASYFFLKPLDLHKLRNAIRQCIYANNQLQHNNKSTMEIDFSKAS
ncbi:MAG: response regulator [Ignavibacteriae bacterium]|nr:response regulator [Ignavibacteriota bacterium]